MSADEPLIVLRCTPQRRHADDWSLVLQAERIPSQLQLGEDGYELSVREVDAARAERAITAFDGEMAAKREPKPVHVEYGDTHAGFALAAALLAFHFVARGSPWLDELGVASSRAILRGELWRTITALTLHADAGHVFANAVSSAVFATLLFRAIGPGVGATLMLTAGAAANLLNAWFHGPGHFSVGASSALFGGIGILSGLQFAARWRYRLRRRQAWFPLAAGLGLLAMLGMGGIRTDVLAHVFGLASGIPLGAIAGFTLHAPPRAAVQWALLACALAVIVGAWLCGA